MTTGSAEVVQWCQANGVVVIPGVATPTEVLISGDFRWDPTIELFTKGL